MTKMVVLLMCLFGIGFEDGQTAPPTLRKGMTRKQAEAALGDRAERVWEFIIGPWEYVGPTVYYKDVIVQYNPEERVIRWESRKK